MGITVIVTPKTPDGEWVNARVGHAITVGTSDECLALMTAGAILARDDSDIDFSGYTVRLSRITP
jgi:hypothetical protein